jgi:hypothetical protein
MARETRTFEKHLEDDLHLLLDKHVTGTIPAWRMPAQGSRRRVVPVGGGAGAALGAKIVTGAAIAVLAAGATTEIVITHSANPVDWARSVQQQVQPSPPSHGGPAHSQPTSAVHPSAPSVAGGSPTVPPRVSPPSLPTVIPSLPIPTPSVPRLP